MKGTWFALRNEQISIESSCASLMPRSIIPCYIGYFLAQENVSCTSIGAVPVEDLKSCKEAVQSSKRTHANVYFHRDVNYQYLPKGCFLLLTGSGNAVFFNSHLTGSKSSDIRLMCAKSDPTNS